MIDIVLQGVVLGLLLSVLVGVTFFVLMETSLRHGFVSALFMSGGIISSDIIILFLVWYFSKGVMENIIENPIFRYVSCLVFLGFGAFYIINSRSVRFHDSATGKNRLRLFLQGFTVNTFNPSVLIFWTGAILVAVSRQEFSRSDLMIYFGTALSVVLLTDLFKIYFAGRIKRWLTVKHLKRVYFGVGILLFLFGIKLLVFG